MSELSAQPLVGLLQLAPVHTMLKTETRTLLNDDYQKIQDGTDDGQCVIFKDTYENARS